MAIFAPGAEALDAARAIIDRILGASTRPGTAYSGRVVSLKDFGAIVELANGDQARGDSCATWSQSADAPQSQWPFVRVSRDDSRGAPGAHRRACCTSLRLRTSGRTGSKTPWLSMTRQARARNDRACLLSAQWCWAALAGLLGRCASPVYAASLALSVGFVCAPG